MAGKHTSEAYTFTSKIATLRERSTVIAHLIGRIACQTGVYIIGLTFLGSDVTLGQSGSRTDRRSGIDGTKNGEASARTRKCSTKHVQNHTPDSRSEFCQHCGAASLVSNLS